MTAIAVMLLLLAGTSYISWTWSRDYHTYTDNRYWEIREQQVCSEAERTELL